MVQVIIATRILVVLFAICGIIVNLVISHDIKCNYKAARSLGVNSNLGITARIDIRATRASVGAHAMFLVLGLIALGSGVPPLGNIHFFGLIVSRRLVAVLFAILWDCIQSLVVIAQIKNQIDRVHYRNLS